MFYTTREQEYRFAGWIGTVRVMQEAGSRALDEDILSRHATLNSVGTRALNMCVQLFQKPQDFRAIIHDEMEQIRGSTRMAYVPDMLQLTGITHFTNTSPRQVMHAEFEDAMEYITDADLQQMVHSLTDFPRLLDEIELQTAYYAKQYVARMCNLDHSAYQLVRREIEFYVGLNDPLTKK